MFEKFVHQCHKRHLIFLQIDRQYQSINDKVSVTNASADARGRSTADFSTHFSFKAKD